MAQTMVFDKFLFGLSCIYLMAFVSFYVQLPGLYGDQGILPVYISVQKDEVHSLQHFLASQPSLIRFAPHLGLTNAQGMELVAGLGCLLAFAVCILPLARNSVTFLLLWLLYLSLFHVGQTFMWFQWDILLLEAGFITIGLSLRLPFSDAKNGSGCGLRMFGVKWLLFRLMFASGIVKLTSDCPTWWGLTALDWHYESQCLPTPVAWFSHQLPHWFQALCVVATYVIEIAVPFLFFVPIRAVRKFCFFAQLLLQGSIIVSGNYNFFNLLTVCLCLSLLNDGDFSARKGYSRIWGIRSVERLVTLVLLSGLAYYTVKLFKLSVGPGLRVNSEIAFTMADLQKFNYNGLMFSVYIGAAWLVYEAAAAVVGAALKSRGPIAKLIGVFQALLISAFLALLFTASLVPHCATDSSLQGSLPPAVRLVHRRVQGLEIVNSYGLFRRMTGVGGRPELVLEGSSESARGPWLEYHFAHKPGNLSQAPTLVAPHQPRLDWQMWFAALGSYQHNPWLIHLVYRLLRNEPSVTALLARGGGGNPFPQGSPPRYIRGLLYTYRYTTWGDRDWWRRELEREYLHPVDVASLAEFLKSQGVREVPPPPRRGRTPATTSASEWAVTAAAAAAASAAERVRAIVGQPDGLRAVAAALAGVACVRLVVGRVLPDM